MFCLEAVAAPGVFLTWRPPCDAGKRGGICYVRRTAIQIWRFSFFNVKGSAKVLPPFLFGGGGGLKNEWW